MTSGVLPFAESRCHEKQKTYRTNVAVQIPAMIRFVLVKGYSGVNLNIC